MNAQLSWLDRPYQRHSDTSQDAANSISESRAETDRARVACRQIAEQSDNLERVSHRIAGAIEEFCDLHCGQTFHADQLRLWVETRCGKTAPGSADRVLRDMRQRGAVKYSVVNRAKSLYRCGP